MKLHEQNNRGITFVKNLDSGETVLFNKDDAKLESITRGDFSCRCYPSQHNVNQTVEEVCEICDSNDLDCRICYLYKIGFIKDITKYLNMEPDETREIFREETGYEL